jgi:hypothetical protein
MHAVRTTATAAVVAASLCLAGSAQARTIPAAEVAAFPVFAKPAAQHVPRVVRRLASDVRTVRRYGIDVRQARPITGLRGGTWYAIPGRDGVCLVVSAASVCQRLTEAIAGRLTMSIGSTPAAPDQTATFIGLAPAGVTGTLVTPTSGDPVAAAIGPDGAYRVKVVGPLKRFDLTRADGAAPLNVMDLS